MYNWQLKDGKQDNILSSKTRFNISRYLLICSHLALFLFIIGVLFSSGVQNYEGSIYTGLSDYIWLLMVLSLTLSVISVTLSNNTTHSIHGISNILIIIVLYHLLPLLRGYWIYGQGGADVFTHLAFSKMILNTQHIPQTDWYPIVHLIFTTLNLLGLPLRKAPIVLSTVSTLIYIVGIYLYIRQTTHERSVSLAILVAVPLLYMKFHHTTQPAILSFLMLPLSGMIVQKLYQNNSIRLLVVLQILVICIVFYHPVTTIFLFSFILTLFISKILYKHAGAEIALNKKGWAPLTVIGGIIGSYWYGGHVRIRGIGIRLLTSSGENQTVVEKQAMMAGRTKTMKQLVVGFTESYGPIFIYLIIASSIVLIILLKSFSDKYTKMRNDEVQGEDLHLVSQFGVGFVITIVFISTNVVVDNAIRSARYFIMISTLLIARYFVVYLNQVKTGRIGLKKACIVSLIILAITLPAVISFTNSYKMNYHFPESQEEGLDWQVSYLDDSTPVYSFRVPYKMIMYINGGYHNDSHNKIQESSAISSHLYIECDSSSNEGLYLTTKEYDLEYVEQLRKDTRDESTVYTNKEIERLSLNREANKVYDNGNFSNWSACS